MELVVIESPYAGDVARNEEYARACVKDCLKRGESPYASHLFFTQPGVLDDTIPKERQWGIDAGLAWAAKASKSVVYLDYGMSIGMRYGIRHAARNGRKVEIRKLYSDVAEEECALVSEIIEEERKKLIAESVASLQQLEGGYAQDVRDQVDAELSGLIRPLSVYDIASYEKAAEANVAALEENPEKKPIS